MSVRWVPGTLLLLVLASWLYQRDRNLLALICVVLAALGPMFAFLEG